VSTFLISDDKYIVDYDVNTRSNWNYSQRIIIPSLEFIKIFLRSRNEYFADKADTNYIMLTEQRDYIYKSLLFKISYQFYANAVREFML